jgi:hypothetical protein
MLVAGLTGVAACGSRSTCTDVREISAPLGRPHAAPASNARLANLPQDTPARIDKSNLVVDRHGNGWLYAGAEWTREQSNQPGLATVEFHTYTIMKDQEGLHVWFGEDSGLPVRIASAGKPKRINGFDFLPVAAFHDGTPPRPGPRLEQLPKSRLARLVTDLGSGSSGYVPSLVIWQEAKPGGSDKHASVYRLRPYTLVANARGEFYDTPIKNEGGQLTVSLPKKTRFKTDPPNCSKPAPSDLNIKVKLV